MEKSNSKSVRQFLFLLLASLILFSFIPSISATGPYIALLQPSSTYSTSERTIYFQFIYHRGDTGADSESCKLLINGTDISSFDIADSQTGQVVIRGFVIGTYRWAIYCNSTLSSSNRTLYIDPGVRPSVNLIAPLSSYKGDVAVPFRFIYSAGDDAPPNATCEFWINDTLVQTLDVVGGDTQVVEKKDLGPGTYTWHVICGQDTKYEAKSPFYSFVIRKTSKPVVVNTTPVVLPPVPQPDTPPADTSGASLPDSSGSIPAAPQAGVRMATLSAPSSARMGDVVSLHLSLSDGSYAPYASIKVYGPSVHSLITDENGTVSFSPSGIGNYTYSVPDFALLQNPKTEVSPQAANPIGMLDISAGLPMLMSSLPTLFSSMPIICSFVILIILIIALALFINHQRARAKEERLLHPEHISPTSLVGTASFEPGPETPVVSPSSTASPQSDSVSPTTLSPSAAAPASGQASSLQLPKDKVIEANPLAPPPLASIPDEPRASGKSIELSEPAQAIPAPPKPMRSIPLSTKPVSKAKGGVLFAPLPPPKSKK